MKITKVKFYDTGEHKNPKFLACCSVVLDNSLMLNGIRVMLGKKGRYVIMPTKERVKDGSVERKDGEDVFHPVKQSYFAYMSEVILKGYEVYEKEGNLVYFPQFGGIKVAKKKELQYYNERLKGKYLTDKDCQILENLMKLSENNGCVEDLRHVIYNLTPDEVEQVKANRSSEFLDLEVGELRPE